MTRMFGRKFLIGAEDGAIKTTNYLLCYRSSEIRYFYNAM